MAEDGNRRSAVHFGHCQNHVSPTPLARNCNAIQRLMHALIFGEDYDFHIFVGSFLEILGESLKIDPVPEQPVLTKDIVPIHIYVSVNFCNCATQLTNSSSKYF